MMSKTNSVALRYRATELVSGNPGLVRQLGSVRNSRVHSRGPPRVAVQTGGDGGSRSVQDAGLSSDRMSLAVQPDCNVAEVVEDQLAGLRGEEFVDQLCTPQFLREGDWSPAPAVWVLRVFPAGAPPWLCICAMTRTSRPDADIAAPSCYSCISPVGFSVRCCGTVPVAPGQGLFHDRVGSLLVPFAKGSKNGIPSHDHASCRMLD